VTTALTAEDVIEILGLRPLEHEGGWWAQTHLDTHGSAIYYLLRTGERSHLHRLPGPEVYHYHAGAPLELLLLHADGTVSTPRLGPDLAAGERPQLVVPGGTWQGSRSAGAWTLAGTTMAPAFRGHDYEHGTRHRLIGGWPAATALIVALTDPTPPTP
jgi:hypothetical protein